MACAVKARTVAAVAPASSWHASRSTTQYLSTAQAMRAVCPSTAGRRRHIAPKPASARGFLPCLPSKVMVAGGGGGGVSVSVRVVGALATVICVSPCGSAPHPGGPAVHGIATRRRNRTRSISDVPDPLRGKGTTTRPPRRSPRRAPGVGRIAGTRKARGLRGLRCPAERVGGQGRAMETPPVRPAGEELGMRRRAAVRMPGGRRPPDGGREAWRSWRWWPRGRATTEAGA
jgi:hypothetical protein